jgi:hypothetical protein
MAISNSMRFTLKTLVDITPTHARRTEDRYMYKQHQNYMTMFNTLGLRSNPVSVVVTSNEEDTKEFGKKYTGKHTVWTVEFEIEREGGVDLELLKQDYNLVPFINELGETATFNKHVFQTTDSQYNNIVFAKV